MRYGNFSSSEIWKLCTNDKSKGFGKPALTYIQEKIWERKLGRSLKNHVHSIETAWGTLLEKFAFKHMDLDYSLVSDEKRLIHPEVHSWTGVPDVKSLDLVGDIKCPFTLNSYCQMVEMDTREKLKEDKPEYYWQLVSNAILTERNKAGLFLFVPYQDELNEVREIAAKHDGDLPISWIVNAPDKKMPYLISGMTYKNLHELIFEVPQEDKDFLTNRVIEAQELLLA